MERLGTLIHQPKNTMPRIEEVYMVVSVDAEDGNEGVVASSFGNVMMPLIAADKTRLDAILPIAQNMADLTEKPLRLIKFTMREDVEVITPKG